MVRGRSVETPSETDGAIVRLTTLIGNGETDAAAEARLRSVLDELVVPLPRFIPE